MELPALANHRLVVLWVELAALLIVARALGALARRFGQPAVVGELLAGLLLGPSVLGQLWPAGFHWFLPSGGTQGDLLSTVAAVALVLLLVVIGADTDLALIRSLGRAAVLVSVLGLAVPLAAGLASGVLLPGDLLGPRHDRVVFALLVAGCVAVSSLPVIAKIVDGLGAVRRNFGQLALAAGSANDMAGFLVVAVATGLVGAGSSSGHQLVKALVGLVVLVILAFTVLQRVVDALLRRVRRGGPNVVGSLTICLVTALVAAAATQVIGVEGALGGFVAGVVLGRSRFQQGDALQLLGRLSNAFLAPIYFATAGLRVNLAELGRVPVLVSFAVLTAVAGATKFAGGFLGARAAGLGWRESSALGVGLNGRGALQVIMATAGLAVGVFNAAAYTVVILLSMVTSVATPPLLRTIVTGWHGSDEERQRLDREEQLERNVVVRGQRLLLPSRGSPNSLAAAEVLHCAWPDASQITILSVGEDTEGRRPDTGAAAQVLEARGVERRHVSSDQILETILAEAHLGYGVIGLGAAEDPGPERLLSVVVDDLLARSPIPMVIVRRARNLDSPLPPAFARVLVPLKGTASSRAGLEVAGNISRNLGTALVLLHVVTRPADEAGESPATMDPPQDGASWPGVAPSAPPATGGASPGTPRRSATGAGKGVLREAEVLAREMGVAPDLLVRHGPAAGTEIVETAREVDADLVVLGATVRLVEDRPFLGHTVEQVLAQSPTTVVVVVLPDPASPAVSAAQRAAAST